TKLKVDLLSASAHKLNGPKGIGFLFQRKGLQTSPIFFGGQQERKRRAGTENVPAIVAFAETVKIAQRQMVENREKYKRYADIMTTVFDDNGIEYEVNANGARKLPHVLNISFPNTDIESL